LDMQIASYTDSDSEIGNQDVNSALNSPVLSKIEDSNLLSIVEGEKVEMENSNDNVTNTINVDSKDYADSKDNVDSKDNANSNKNVTTDNNVSVEDNNNNVSIEDNNNNNNVSVEDNNNNNVDTNINLNLDSNVDGNGNINNNVNFGKNNVNFCINKILGIKSDVAVTAVDMSRPYLCQYCTGLKCYFIYL